MCVCVFMCVCMCMCVQGVHVYQVCMCLNRKQSQGCWRLHKGAFEWLGSGKFIADVRERISTQVEWPFTAKATGVQSRGGRRTADRSQERHTQIHLHTHTHTHTGWTPISQEGPVHSIKQETGVFLWATLALKLRIILPFIPERTTMIALCGSLSRFSMHVYKFRPGVCYRDGLHKLDHAFWFPLDPRSLERSEARLYATFPGSHWRQRRGRERLAPHRQLTSSHTEGTAR